MMLQYLPLIIFVVVVSVISIRLDRYWQSRQGSNEEEEGETADAKVGLATRMTGGIKGSWHKLRGKRSGQLAEQFKHWISEDLKGEKGLKEWIGALSEEGVQALTAQLSAFCTDLNLELAWLVEGKLDSDSDLKKTAQAVVVSYCSACWQAAQGQTSLNVFKTFQAFEQDPTNKKYHDFSRKLYAHLTEKKLVSLPPVSEMLATSEKERQKQVVQAIQEVAKTDQSALTKALKAIAAEDSPPQEKAKAPAPKAKPKMSKASTPPKAAGKKKQPAATA